MTSIDDFRKKFDEEGRYRDGDGVLDVEFVTSGGNGYPGKLHFSDGYCVRAEMQGASPWAYPDNSALNEIRFLLQFEGNESHTVAVEQGRIVPFTPVLDRFGKQKFLAKLRIARNLFVHGGNTAGDTGAPEALTRSAIWLTPNSVRGFNAADFAELGRDQQAALQSAVLDFLAVAKEVPANQVATPEQYRNGTAAFQKILDILEPYLPTPDEAKKVERAIKSIKFPAWLVNWDFELGSNEGGDPAVWVSVFAEEGAPRKDFGRFVINITPTIRQALTTEGVSRWPYIRLRTATEHKSA